MQPWIIFLFFNISGYENLVYFFDSNNSQSYIFFSIQSKMFCKTFNFHFTDEYFYDDSHDIIANISNKEGREYYQLMPPLIGCEFSFNSSTNESSYMILGNWENRHLYNRVLKYSVARSTYEASQIEKCLRPMRRRKMLVDRERFLMIPLTQTDYNSPLRSTNLRFHVHTRHQIHA